MSLLYECINGIIQGGILDGAEALPEGSEIASLCVEKLRGMIMVEGDPNREFQYRCSIHQARLKFAFSQIRCTFGLQ